MTAGTPDRIVLERRVAAPIGTVFRFLTEGELWARWQGASAELEPRPGGRFRMTMRTGQIAEGTFLEVEPERRIVFTWGWKGHDLVPPGSSTVEIDLVPDGDGTLLRLTHRGLPTVEELDLHAAGWRHYLARLGVVAGGGDPGVDALPG